MMSKKLSFKDACFQWASGFYLTEHLPDEWFIEHESNWPEGYDSFEEYQNDKPFHEIFHCLVKK